MKKAASVKGFNSPTTTCLSDGALTMISKHCLSDGALTMNSKHCLKEGSGRELGHNTLQCSIPRQVNSRSVTSFVAVMLSTCKCRVNGCQGMWLRVSMEPKETIDNKRRRISLLAFSLGDIEAAERSWLLVAFSGKGRVLLDGGFTFRKIGC